MKSQEPDFLVEIIPAVTSNTPAIKSLRGSIDRPAFYFPKDLGTNWLNQGAVGGTAVNTICFIGNGVIIIGDSFGDIFRSVDQGKTWQFISAPDLSFLSCANFGNGIAILGGGGGGVGNGVQRTTNYGITWANVNSANFGTVTYLTIGIGIAGDQFGKLWRTTNFGLTWSQPFGTLPGSIISSAYLGNGVVLAGDNAGNLTRSTNFGASYTSQGNVTGSAINTISYLENDVVVLGTANQHVWRSTDAGLTWLDLGVITTASITTSRYLWNGILILGSDSNVYRSADFGLTYQQIVLPGGVSILSSDYASDGVVVLGDSAGNSWRSDVAFKYDEAGFWQAALKASAAALIGGQVLFPDVNGFVVGDAGLFWDNTHKRLGVGTPSPARQFHIKAGTAGNIGIATTDGDDGTSDGGSEYELFYNGLFKWGLCVRNNGTNPFGLAFTTTENDTTSAAVKLFITLAGLVGVGTVAPGFAVDVAGQVHATAFPVSSDERFKKNIKKLDNVLPRICSLSGVSFEWNDLYRSLGRATEGRQIGLIAQEVEREFPEVVSRYRAEKGDVVVEDARALDYGRLVPVLIEAIKELAARVKELEGKAN